MNLILIRHAKCAGNTGGDPWAEDSVRIGSLDLPLTNEGLSQAKVLAKKMARMKIDVIYSSDLIRARCTTKEIAKLHKVSVYHTHELRERNLGELTGLTIKEIKECLKAMPGRPDYKRPKNGESRIEFKQRIENFFRKILKKHLKSNKNIAVVTHSGVIRALLLFLYKIPFSFENLKQVENLLNVKLPPASLLVLNITETKDKNFDVSITENFVVH